MPSKLRKALGAVKDQTSISIAKVSSANSSSTTINLEVPILKATSHDEVPFDNNNQNRYLTEILQAIATDKVYAAACAQAIAKRLGKTRNWIVALKSLMLVFRIFQDGNPHFPREVLHAMKTGSKILNLSAFRDDWNSSPWDYTSFVRTFALYLDERLDCFLSGKLHQRHGKRRAKIEPVRDMKPATLIDRISHWQKLLDRAIATRPTGEAKTNRLVQSSLLAIVQESFDLYRDISDGLALLLDSFFHLQYQSCVNAFQASVRASKQFEELSEFYALCKSIGVGRTSEYPSVQKISDELIETLQEFLKDQASFPGRSPPLLLLAPAPAPAGDQASTSDQSEANFGRPDTPERVSGSQCSSPDHDENPMSATDSEKTEEDFIDAEDDDDQGTNLGCWPPAPENEDQESGVGENPRDYWELVLVDTAKEPAQTTPSFESNGQDSSTLNGLLDKRQYNPFLQETTVIAPSTTQEEIGVWVAPTFRAQNSEENLSLSSRDIGEDPFESNEVTSRSDEQSFIHEQKLWLEHQKKIIAKNMNLN